MALDFDYLHKYLQKVTPPRPEVLQAMEKLAREKDFPIIGPLVGRFLYQLVKLTGARRVFEMGSGYGYSALWFVLALPAGGTVFCTDGEEDNRQKAEYFFKKAGVLQKLRFEVGDGVEILKKSKGQSDIILNDIDKQDYPRALEAAIPKLKKGGILVSDNMFRGGEVFKYPEHPDSRGVITYTKRIYSDKRLFSSIMPIRDGISISIKLKCLPEAIPFNSLTGSVSK